MGERGCTLSLPVYNWKNLCGERIVDELYRSWVVEMLLWVYFVLKVYLDEVLYYSFWVKNLKRIGIINYNYKWCVMWLFLKEGKKFKSKCRTTYLCCISYWGYVYIVGFICYRLGSKEPKTELKDLKYKVYRMYVVLM